MIIIFFDLVKNVFFLFCCILFEKKKNKMLIYFFNISVYVCFIWLLIYLCVLKIKNIYFKNLRNIINLNI